MAEDPGQIREAIDETRSEIAGTMQALGAKADVKGRVTEAVNEKAGVVREKASQPQSQQIAGGVLVALFLLILLRRRHRAKAARSG